MMEVGEDAQMPRDSDSDGMPDYRDQDSDNDGIRDGAEDANHDGVIAGDTNNNRVWNVGESWGETDPLSPDTDGDGFGDGAEWGGGDSAIDSDGDGVSDPLDAQYGSNSDRSDVDGDSLGDAEETLFQPPLVTDVHLFSGNRTNDLFTVGFPITIEITEGYAISDLSGRIIIWHAVTGYREILPVSSGMSGTYSATWDTAGLPLSSSYEIGAQLWCPRAGWEFGSNASSAGWAQLDAATRLEVANGSLRLTGRAGHANVVSPPIPAAYHSSMTFAVHASTCASGTVSFVSWPDGSPILGGNLPFTILETNSLAAQTFTFDLTEVPLDEDTDYQLRFDFAARDGCTNPVVEIDYVRLYSGEFDPNLPSGGADRDGLPIDVGVGMYTNGADAHITLVNPGTRTFDNFVNTNLNEDLLWENVEIKNSSIVTLTGRNNACRTLTIDSGSSLKISQPDTHLVVDSLTNSGTIHIMDGATLHLYIRQDAAIDANATLSGANGTVANIHCTLATDPFAAANVTVPEYNWGPPRAVVYSQTHPSSNVDYLGSLMGWRAVSPYFEGHESFRYRLDTIPDTNTPGFAVQQFENNAVTALPGSNIWVNLATCSQTGRVSRWTTHVNRHYYEPVAPQIDATINGLPDAPPETYIVPNEPYGSSTEWRDGPGHNRASFSFDLPGIRPGSVRWRCWLDKCSNTIMTAAHSISGTNIVEYTGLKCGRWWFHVAAEDTVGTIGTTAHRMFSVGHPLNFDWDADPNDIDGDDDNDGISDSAETSTYGTNPLDRDTDNDGLTDSEEGTTGTDRLAFDTDGDGVRDGLDAFPTDGEKWADTDGDGVPDQDDPEPLNALAAIENLAVQDGTSPMRGSVDVTFQLDDPEDGPVAVSIWWSTNAGASWAQASLGEACTGLSSGQQSIAWLSATDLGLTSNDNVLVRAQPNDGAVGLMVTSAVSYVIDNTTVPAVADLTIPGGELSGEVTGITYTVTGSPGETGTAIFEFSRDGGATWEDAASWEFGTYTIPQAASLSWLSADTGGFFWDEQLPHQDNSTVYFRVTPVEDGTLEEGMSAVVGPLHIDNNGPPSVGTITVSDIDAPGFTIEIGVTVEDAENDAVEASGWEYSTDGGSFWRGATVSNESASWVSDGITTNRLLWSSAWDLPDHDYSNVLFRVGVADNDPGTGGTSTTFVVDNENSRPECQLTGLSLTNTTPTALIRVDYSYVDGDGDNVTTRGWQFSTDGGSAWHDIHASSIVSNVCEGDGTGYVVWDTRNGTNSLQGVQQGGVLFRAMGHDGRPTVGWEWDCPQSVTNADRLTWKAEGANTGLWALCGADLQQLLGWTDITEGATDTLAALEQLGPGGFLFDGPDRMIGCAVVFGPGTVARVAKNGTSSYASQVAPYLLETTAMAQGTNGFYWLAGEGQDGFEISLRSFENGLPLQGGRKYFPAVTNISGMWADPATNTLWVLQEEPATLYEFDVSTGLVEICRLPMGATTAKGLAHDGNAFRLLDSASAKLQRTAGIPYSRWSVSPAFDVDNSDLPPEANELHFASSSCGAGVPVEARWLYTDPNANIETDTEVLWYRVGQGSASYTGTVNGVVGQYSYGRLPFSYTTRGQQWWFAVTPSDGLEAGSLASSLDTSVTAGNVTQIVSIVNTPPIVSDILVTPQDVPGVKLYRTDTFQISTLTFSDADSDGVTPSYQWWKGQTNAPVEAIAGATSSTFVPINYGLTHYDAFFCAVKGHDGYEYGDVYDSNPVLLDNAPPVFTNVATALVFYQGSNYVISPVAAADPEGDAVTYVFAGWRTSQSGSLDPTTPTGEFGETVYAQSAYNPAFEASPPSSMANIRVVVLASPTTDDDADGVPDGWEARYWSMSVYTNPAYDAQADIDGDTMKNWEEEVADTDPTSPLSVFTVEDVSSGTDASVTVYVQTSLGRNYQLLCNTNLLDAGGWTNASAVVPGDGTLLPIQDTNTARSSFYRIKVWKQE